MSEEYDLNKSSKELGKLVPILKDAQGNIIDGFHRIEADPKWKSITVETVDNPVKLELARLAVNFCRRRMSPSELQQRISFLVGAGLSAEEIADKTGVGKTTVYKYMPQGFKDSERSDAIKAGIQNHRKSYDECSSANISRKTSETNKNGLATIKMPPQPKSELTSFEKGDLYTPKDLAEKEDDPINEINGQIPTPTDFLRTVKCPHCGKRFVLPEEA